ncbi:MAG: metallophosphoesterase [Gemmatimonadales bacterium]|nr:MAG: metallophosphoesterase [Gemmatimonadales bacterium]
MPSRITRRRFLAIGTTVAAGTLVPSLGPAESNRVSLTRHRVRVPGLPSSLDRMRIAQVSDLHLYDGVHPVADDVLALLDRERPDLVVLTGDQWDRMEGSRTLSHWLRSLPGSLPVIAVLGNHEYWAGTTTAQAERIHEQAGAALLVNRAETCAINGAALTIVGLDDLRAGQPDAMTAAGAALPGVPQIWLIHEPGHVDLVEWPDAAEPALILSGHTHGGQIRLPGVPPVLPWGSGSYLAGWYRTSAGPMYVSRGVGSIGIRTRFRCPPELPIFTLEAA